LPDAKAGDNDAEGEKRNNIRNKGGFNLPPFFLRKIHDDKGRYKHYDKR
jgi:hypothetical protein